MNWLVLGLGLVRLWGLLEWCEVSSVSVLEVLLSMFV